MVEFRGIILNETSAKLNKMALVKNIGVNITIDKVEIKADDLFVDFTYNVIYEPKVGHLMFRGNVAFTDSSSKLLEYKKHWEKTNMFPQSIMESLMNLINVTAGVNGVLVTRAINLAPPLVPPKLEVTVPKNLPKKNIKKAKKT